MKANDWMAPLLNNSYAVWKTPEMNLKLYLPPSVKSCKMPGRRARHPTKRMKHRKHCWKSISHQVHKLRQKEQRYPDTRKRQKITSPKKGQKLRKIPGPATKVEAQKEAVRQVLDRASGAKCQTDPKVIEETYTEKFKSVGPMVDLPNHLGLFIEPPLPPTTSEKDSNAKQTHADPNSQTRQAEPSCWMQ